MKTNSCIAALKTVKLLFDFSTYNIKPIGISEETENLSEISPQKKAVK